MLGAVLEAGWPLDPAPVFPVAELPLAFSVLELPVFGLLLLELLPVLGLLGAELATGGFPAGTKLPMDALGVSALGAPGGTLLGPSPEP